MCNRESRRGPLQNETWFIECGEFPSWPGADTSETLMYINNAGPKQNKCRLD